MTNKKKLQKEEQEKLLKTLRTRFEKNRARHKGIEWEDVEKKLLGSPVKMWSVWQMEDTGGEPDVTGFDKKSGSYVFSDCSPESPKDRRSLCYDQEALDARKEHKPKDSAVNMAEDMGIELMTEEEYRDLQKLGEFDLKTSSWVKTPKAIRELGGAVFCDRRYGQVFLYHNGAQSYYASRGFRGTIKV